jgi:electron transfer flavoprotein alpha subunit
MSGADDSPSCRFDRPLRVAALVKQIPVGESMTLGADGRLVREGLELEMNAFCRRAVSKGVEWAGASGGSCTVLTLGPPSAEDVLREAIAWGADDGIHLCDAAFAGSDTLATANALSAALGSAGPFDLVLVGRNTLDGDTGQVGPEVAQLSGLPFASGVRVMGLDGGRLSLTLEHDDGAEEVEVDLPAVLSVAERLCEPCKVPPEERAAVPDDRIAVVSAAELGEGPWGQAASPTTVGATRVMHHDRAGKILSGSVDDQVAEALDLLAERGALTPSPVVDTDASLSLEREISARAFGDGDPVIAVVVEPGRPRVASELLGAASGLADSIGGLVHAVTFGEDRPESLGTWGADLVTDFEGAAVAEDAAASMLAWFTGKNPWAVLGPSTAFGRELLGRLAAATGSGMVGDAVAVAVANGELVAAKPAFSGALVADISFTSDLRMVSVRPGVLAFPTRRSYLAPVTTEKLQRGSRLSSIAQRPDDDVEVLARAEVVIGVGAAVRPGEYEALAPLASLLGAELAATRKVTDQGWAPRARQVGITGRSIAPRLYVALGSSGKFNHMVGVRAAGTILAINIDPEAPVHTHCDVGIVGDWHEVVSALAAALRGTRAAFHS